MKEVVLNEELVSSIIKDWVIGHLDVDVLYVYLTIRMESSGAGQIIAKVMICDDERGMEK